MAINFNTLFTQLGKGFFVQKSINAARASAGTIPPLFKALLDQFNSASLEFKQAIGGVEPANRSFQNGSDAAMSALRTALQGIVIETVRVDNPQPTLDLTVALREIVRQMTATAQTVDASTVSASIATDSGNFGDGVLVVSTKRPDGRAQENILAEDLRVTISSAVTPSTATLLCQGEAAAGDRLSMDWPRGSATGRSLNAIDAAASLLANGDFDDSDDVANAPDDWIVSVGSIGTTLKTTVYEVQRLVVTGPPTAGTYTISWTNQSGKTQTTAPLAFDASGSTVQAELQRLTGLENVTVSTTGTSPLFTHDITFTGVAGNLNQITITNNTTGGTYTPSTVSNGSANAFIGRAVEFDSNGAELTTLNNRVTLEPLKQYAFNLWAMVDVVPAAGVLTVDLVDGIGGTVINDEAGTANSFTIAATGLTTSFAARNGVFRTPRVLPSIVYLRIRISTAVSNTTSVFLDHSALAEMTELYSGGPSLAAFSGKTAWTAGNEQVLPDGYTITTTNDRAGEMQEFFQRNFDMAAKRLLLPSNNAGGETILDSLIA